MKFLMPLVLAAFLLVGCDRLEGQLNITKDLKLVNSKGNTHLLRVGTYSADLRQSTFGKKIVLRLNNDSDEKFHFLIPGKQLPSNGTFKFTAAQIGQNVDLTGTVKTVYTDSSMRDGFQQCTYMRPETVCQPSGPTGGVVCHTEMRTVYGSQRIRYYDRTTTQDVTLSIAAAGATEESAQFAGGATWIERIIVNQTACL
ncbi:MAG: hypothetical protein KBD76_09405 [Bacteriovorax sp.]|nr:hypothetical protein [Bacteriovorax sp.]